MVDGAFLGGFGSAGWYCISGHFIFELCMNEREWSQSRRSEGRRFLPNSPLSYFSALKLILTLTVKKVWMHFKWPQALDPIVIFNYKVFRFCEDETTFGEQSNLHFQPNGNKAESRQRSSVHTLIELYFFAPSSWKNVSRSEFHFIIDWLSAYLYQSFIFHFHDWLTNS